jgi:alpha-aminoadipic semialdehyde synthase
MLELDCTLVDYEKVRDDTGHRLIHFGRFAGLAGTIDLLWALGRRLEWEGVPSPFKMIEPAHRYPSLEAAKSAVRDVAARIRVEGLPEALRPLVFGITGRGNVSGGAHEILDCLPIERVDAEHLADLHERVRRGETDAAHHVYTVVFGNRHVVEPLEANKPFDKTEYRSHPERFRPTFHRHLPHVTALVNGIYWDARYPRLVTIDDLRLLYGGEEQPRLRVIADITADIGGAIEATVKPTDPKDPVFVYDPQKARAIDGWKGRGPVILAVDFLPTELPVEASARFGDALCPFVPSLARAAYDVDFASLDLPPELLRAVIAHGGELAPDYRYIAEHLGRAANP